MRLICNRLFRRYKLPLRGGQLLPRPVRLGRRIAHGVRRPRPPPAQKIAPALALRARKPRQDLGATVGAVALLAPRPRRGLLHAHLRRDG